jgi:hypothetical protein
MSDEKMFLERVGHRPLLKIHNDGKEKHESWEAYCDDIDCERGYGATEEEAVIAYRLNLYKLIDTISAVRSLLFTQEGVSNKAYVDCHGNKR